MFTSRFPGGIPRSVARRYQAMPLCAGWGKDALARLDAVADLAEYEPGDVVLSAGFTQPEFVVLVCGRVQLVDRGRRAGTLSAGDWIGDDAVLTGTAQPTTAIATTYTEALHVHKRHFTALYDTCPELRRALTRSTIPPQRVPMSTLPAQLGRLDVADASGLLGPQRRS